VVTATIFAGLTTSTLFVQNVLYTSDIILECLENIIVDCNIKWRISLLVLGKQRWVFEQKVPETILVTIFRTEMAWSITVNIFGIDVSSCDQKCLDDTKVTSDTSNMQWSTEIFATSIELGFVFNEELN